MLTKIAVLLAIGSVAALAAWYLGESLDEAALEREVAAEWDSLRERLFRR